MEKTDEEVRLEMLELQRKLNEEIRGNGNSKENTTRINYGI